MSNKGFPSDVWDQNDSDYHAVSDDDGLVKMVRIRKQSDNTRVMLTQIFYAGGAKHSEHVFYLHDETDAEAAHLGMDHLKWLSRHAKPR